jgi:hypothetical protein
VGGGVSATNVSVTSATSISATLTIAAAAAIGARDVIVTNPGGEQAVLEDGFSVTAAAPSAPSLTLTFHGRTRDRVGRANVALAPDGSLDGTVTATLRAPGGRTVTAVRLQTSTYGTWDTTAATAYWGLGVAGTLDGPLLNHPATMAVSVPVADGGSFVLFAADSSTGKHFAAGVALTLTTTFADGASVTAKLTIAGPSPAPSEPPPPPPAPPSLTLGFNGKIRDRVGRGNVALAADAAADGIVTVRLSASGGRTITGLKLQTSTWGTWDTSAATAYWVLGVAATADGPLLNNPSTMNVSAMVADGGSLVLVAADSSTNRHFSPGTKLTVTATFSDGSTATSATAVP